MCLLCARYLSGASQVALAVRNLSANIGDIRDAGSIPGSPGGGHGNPLQYSCLENPTDRGAWQATVHGITRVGHDLATKPPPPEKRSYITLPGKGGHSGLMPSNLCVST